MAHTYTEKDISVLSSDRERVQKQPHIYIPSKHLAGVMHLFRECVDNAQDECMQTGETAEVTYSEKTREFTCWDSGRGVPHEKMKELCEVLNSSGKFHKGEENAYLVAGGVHGVGSKLDNFLSDYYEMTSYRDGKAVTRKYEDGIFVKEIKEKSDLHGTFIRFRVSDKYLTDVDKVSCAGIMKMVEEKADACPGFRISFKGVRKDGSKVKEKYTGLNTEELFKKYCKSTSKVWFMEYDDRKKNTACRVGFGYDSKAVSNEEGNVKGWCNFIYNKYGGTHTEAVSDALYEFFKKYMWKDFLSDKDKKDLQLKREDVKLGLCGVVVLTTDEPEYQGQFKELMNSVALGEEIKDFIMKKLDKLQDTDLRAIAGLLKDNIKARMSSIKARQQVKKVGNGLSKDAIEKFIPKKMSCDTDYTEIYIVEGDSAGNHVDSARFPHQAIYKLKGRVDSVYDCTDQELVKKDIIQDLSRIFGMIPSKKNDINSIIPDAVMILSDADPDGYAIRAGVITIVARAFPQLIEDGRLFVVEPPLFGFTDNGKRKFVANNREYAEYLQDKFSKNNDLFYKGNKLSKFEIKSFLLKNERYIEYLTRLAADNDCTVPFVELICAHIEKYGINKSSTDKWNKMIQKEYSNQFKAVWNDGCVEISGIRKGRWEMIELDDSFINSKKTKKVISNMNSNLGNIYGYSIKGTDKADDLSINDIMNIFDKYQGKDMVRYKGLGKMEAEDLRDTCMDACKQQRVIQITTDDIHKSYVDLALWNSQKISARDARRDFMLKYTPDIKELST